MGNVRANGVTAIDASCYCGRRAIADVSALPGAIDQSPYRAGQLNASFSVLAKRRA